MDMKDVNTIDDLIKFIEWRMDIKLKWYTKAWMKFTNWMDLKFKGYSRQNQKR